MVSVKLSALIFHLNARISKNLSDIAIFFHYIKGREFSENEFIRIAYEFT